MSSSNKNIVFDIVGTLVGYDKFFDAIDARIGEKLRAQCVLPKLLGYTWIEVAEREYTYLSLSGVYKPFKTVLKAIFYRMLWMAGIEEPQEFATQEDLDFMMEGYGKMGLRPGAAECVKKLRDAGFTVWAFTAADFERVSGYFAGAGLSWPAENIMSCDSIGIGKPSPEAYKPMLKKLSKDGQPWFGAGHMWDVSAARRVG